MNDCSLPLENIFNIAQIVNQKEVVQMFHMDVIILSLNYKEKIWSSLCYSDTYCLGQKRKIDLAPQYSVLHLNIWQKLMTNSTLLLKSEDLVERFTI